MNRRDLFRVLGAGAILPAFTPEAFALFREAQTGNGYALRTLNPRQNDTVLAMIDQIIPATDTPGAKGARVNEFIDVILTEWANEEERRNFLNGLAAVDEQSIALFGKNFVEAGSAQQIVLLEAMDDAAMAIQQRHVRRSTAETEERYPQLRGNFFKIFKGITLHGYYTSEIGFTQELKEQIIPGALHGCMPVPLEKKA
ncbi:MAG: lactose 3-dehydrogenase subunit gamma LacC [Candidatus Acidiferrum sp.]